MKPHLGSSVHIFKQISRHYNSSKVLLASPKSAKKKLPRYLPPNPINHKQKYDYFFILDFEATCDDTEKPEPQEIIEHACLRFNRKKLEVDSAFHSYIRPVAHPQLTPFCVQLTGIIQEDIDKAPTFDEVWSDFRLWLRSCKFSKDSSIFVTSGNWDLQYMLPHQLNYSQLQPVDDLKQWIDLKKAFCKHYGRFPFGIKDMLKTLKLPHLGKLHNGYDDCTNIVNIVKHMIEDNKILDQTDQLKEPE
nr:PREDICTED: ERI1 exoribonuclease 3-like [Bemisia tabaci]